MSIVEHSWQTAWANCDYLVVNKWVFWRHVGVIILLSRREIS